MVKGVTLFGLGAAAIAMIYVFCSAVRIACIDRALIITPFTVVAGKDRDPGLGEHLAIMLETHLRRMLAELDEAQNTLMKTRWAEEGEQPLAKTLMAPLLISKGVDLPTRAFTVPDLKISVSGVEVGKIIPWVKSSLVSDRAIELSISYEAKGTVITGDIGALSGTSGDSLEIATGSTDSTEIADLVSSCLIRRKLIHEGATQLDALTDLEFLTLVRGLVQINKLNERVKKGRVAQGQFAELLPSMEALVDKVQWNQLIYLTGSLAERGGQADKAVKLYERIANDKRTTALSVPDAALINRVNERLALLKTKPTAHPDQTFAAARASIEADIDYATQQYNSLFETNLAAPSLTIEPEDFLNAYWDGESYHAPPQAQYLPDVTYHEIALQHLGKNASFIYSGMSGAILNSYADILASLLIQRHHHQTAATADWVLVPGVTEWLKGLPGPFKSGVPMRSLKAPGTAYDNPMLGKDPQVDHARNLYTGTTDFGGVHINSGIPNKAFYLVATQLGDTEAAATIWIKALREIAHAKNIDLTMLAAATVRAASKEHQAAVRDAWNQVGVRIGSAP